MSSKQVLRLVAAAFLLLSGVWLTTGSAAATNGTSTVQLIPQADTPSPTLGSTPHENPAPRGDQDGDPADFSQVPWVIIGTVGLAVAVAIVLGIYLLRRQSRSPR